ncbi:unnamed protein product [Trichobilharzia regenti]|nr:unnamed protein product [Trichobilharzia regenti]
MTRKFEFQFRNELAKIVTPGDPRADLHEICRIGKGSTGVVYLMRHSPTKHYVAVKKMNIFKQQRRELLFNELYSTPYFCTSIEFLACDIGGPNFAG